MKRNRRHHERRRPALFTTRGLFEALVLVLLLANVLVMSEAVSLLYRLAEAFGS